MTISYTWIQWILRYKLNHRETGNDLHTKNKNKYLEVFWKMQHFVVYVS